MNTKVTNLNAPSVAAAPEDEDADDLVRSLDAMVIIAENLKLLIAGPIIAGLLAYAATFALPKSYTSVAYLGPLSSQTAGLAEALIRSPRVLDDVLQKHPQYEDGATLEHRRRALDANLKLTLTRGPDSRGDAVLKLEASDSAPARARTLAADLIDAWFAALKPGPDRRAHLERSLEHSKEEATILSNVISNLQKYPAVFAPDAKSGSSASDFGNLIKLRIDVVANIERLETEIAGHSRDLILTPPSLPVTSVWPVKPAIVLWTMVATLIALIMFVLSRNAVRVAAERPDNSAKIARIFDAIRPPRLFR